MGIQLSTHRNDSDINSPPYQDTLAGNHIIYIVMSVSEHDASYHQKNECLEQDILPYIFIKDRYSIFRLKNIQEIKMILCNNDEYLSICKKWGDV